MSSNGSEFLLTNSIKFSRLRFFDRVMAPSHTSFINICLPPSRPPSLFDFVSVVLLAPGPRCSCCDEEGGLSGTVLLNRRRIFVTTLFLVIIRITLEFVMSSNICSLSATSCFGIPCCCRSINTCFNAMLEQILRFVIVFLYSFQLQLFWFIRECISIECFRDCNRWDPS